MSTYKTEQEKFWAEDFGNEYVDRNNNARIPAGNIAMFSKIIERTNGIQSAIEFGANIGLNQKALRTLLPNCELSAIEINAKACSILEHEKIVSKIYKQSILDFKPDYQRDLVLIKGVLIHINPNELNNVYRLMYETSKKYICVAEYYNPTPVAINYRGHENRLFKRDFAGEILDQYKDLRLVDYGFTYHRDTNFDYDDTNWFLLEKTK